MQLLLVRHALPFRTEAGEGSDPNCRRRAGSRPAGCPTRWPAFPITRLVSSPQRRAAQTAEPVAAARNLTVDIDERLAEYDRGMSHYVPIEQVRAERPEEWARMAAGHLPGVVDEDEFRGRVMAALVRHRRRRRTRRHRGGVQPRRRDQRCAARTPGHRPAAVVSHRLRVGDPVAVCPQRTGHGGNGQRHRACLGSATAQQALRFIHIG